MVNKKANTTANHEVQHLQTINRKMDLDN